MSLSTDAHAFVPICDPELLARFGTGRRKSASTLVLCEISLHGLDKDAYGMKNPPEAGLSHLTAKFWLAD
jgi:hypothetical protein